MNDATKESMMRARNATPGQIVRTVRGQTLRIDRVGVGRLS